MLCCLCIDIFIESWGMKNYLWMHSNYMEGVDVKRRSISVWLNCEAIR